MAEWSSEQYLKFKQERTQPSIDLVRRIPLEHPGKILDVGCGPGNSSEVLARTFPGASVLGIDSSEAMIRAAREQHPELSFALCDACTGLPALDTDFDVVFSNACIQWVPDHPALLRRLMDRLRPGGVLAVQTPMNQEEPIRQILRELTGSAAWRAELEGLRLFHNLTPGEYFDELVAIAADFSLWSTTYYHVLDSHRDILEWYKGTGLRPYLAALSGDRARVFEEEVLSCVQERYPRQKDGRIIFRFPRFFFLARAR